jgi:methionyl aminopeptidase
VIIRKSAREIDLMAAAGAVVAGALALLEERLEPGLSMTELDRLAEDFIRSHDAVPTSKGYRGFPAAICISPNEMIVHGIPGDYRAKEGDIVSFDIGVTKDGLIADSAATFGVGEISDEAHRLLDTCQAALEAGIEAAQLGAYVADISGAIQQTVEESGFSVVRNLVGHGVGREYHEDPQVPNFVTAYRGPQLAEGMTLAIEPMITAGGPEVDTLEDDWSIISVDGSLTAHFEHTVAVTPEGPRVLTKASLATPTVRTPGLGSGVRLRR